MENNIIEIPRQPVISPNVKALGYNDERNILAIEMLNNTLYYYLDIPKEHFTNMIDNCPSIGSYLHRNVKGYYRYIRIR